MFPKYIVIATIVTDFIAGGLTQNDSFLLVNDTEVSTNGHDEIGSGGEDEFGYPHENNDNFIVAATTTTEKDYPSTASVDSEYDAHLNDDDTTLGETPNVYLTTVAESGSNADERNENDDDLNDQKTEDEKDCYSLMRPTVFTLIVLALCFICLLFIYTVVCSCFLARKRICDPESPQTIEPQKAKSSAKEKDEKLKKEKTAKLEEAKKKKESKKKEKAEKMEEAKKKKESEEKNRAEKKESEKKEKAEKKKASEKKQKAEQMKQSEKTEKAEKNEGAEKKEETEKETHVEKEKEKVGTSPEESIELADVSKGDAEQTGSPSVKDTLGQLQEVNVVSEDTTTEQQTDETTDKGELRISTIPPPPPIDENEPHSATTEVVIETLPPPPAPEDIKEAQQSSTNENIAAACKTETETVVSTPESKTTEAVVDMTADTNKTESEKKEDLANVEMKFDEVLEMLDSIKQ